MKLVKHTYSILCLLLICNRTHINVIIIRNYLISLKSVFLKNVGCRLIDILNISTNNGRMAKETRVLFVRIEGREKRIISQRYSYFHVL